MRNPESAWTRVAHAEAQRRGEELITDILSAPLSFCERYFLGFGRMVVCGLLTLGLAGLAAGCGQFTGSQGRVAGQDAGGPGWMQETAMSRDGRLDLKTKPWWSQAAALKVGESFTIVSSCDAAGSPTMLVRREALKQGKRDIEAIVWVIDDDCDRSIGAGGDTDSDCYVADYGGDGIVDRMVDYIDNNGDNKADEMDIRYFVDGQLRQVWCGVDHDGDGHMWDVKAYEYSADFFRSDPYGNNMIYMNKFDPQRGTWVPISECPFAFYDTDGDGYSETVVRVSASPLSFDPSTDPDYANDARRYQGVWSDDMGRMGISNIRYSFDIDGLSGKETPLHYDCGFNLVGKQPYDVPSMRHYNSLRRPPQVTCVIPYDDVRKISDSYLACETGFTWHEHHDDTISLGDPLHNPADDYRWEGVFWVWERRFMENTGGPNQKWNVRREWSHKPSRTREVYYSPVDRRIHLYGAEEGWIEIGHLAGLGRIGEVRIYDTDGNGFFDRWEIWLGDSSVPVRVSTIRDDVCPRMRFAYGQIGEFYQDTVIPAAMAASDKLMSAMRAVRPFVVPAELSRASMEGSPTERRYARDIAVELQYQDLRQFYTQQAHKVLDAAKMNDLRGLNTEKRQTTANTQMAWQMVRLLERLDVAYGQGDVEGACAVLKEVGGIKALFEIRE